MSRHFLHDDGIANDKADDPRYIATCLFAHNCTVIQLHKQHQAGFAQAFFRLRFSTRQKSALRELISRIQPYPDDR